MKKWIKKNWNTFLIGYVTGVTTITLINITESIIIKIAILINN